MDAFIEAVARAGKGKWPDRGNDEAFRKVLEDAMTEAAAVTGFETWPKPENGGTFQRALIRIRDHSEVEQICAQFRVKLSIMPHFEKYARRPSDEEAIRVLLKKAASAMADSTCGMVSAYEVTRAREKLEEARAKSMADPLAPFHPAYFTWIAIELASMAPLSDPIVEQLHRPRSGKNSKVLNHARGVRARIQEVARHIFGEAGYGVADTFATAVTGIEFDQDDRRKRSKR
jgi:hypothetical protein